MDGDHGGDQDGDDVDHLDHGIDRRPGRVLVRIPHRVTGDGRGVGLGALPAIVSVLDVFLGVVPRATARMLSEPNRNGRMPPKNRPTITSGSVRLKATGAANPLLTSCVYEENRTSAARPAEPIA